jgi:hypothetical protein
MAEKRRPLLVPALLLTVFSFLFLYIAVRAGEPSPLRFLFPARTSSSWSILEEIRSLNELETAVYDMRVVFPFDFIGDDPAVNWAYLKYQYDREPRLFMAKTDPSWHPGGRLPEEWRHAEIYGLCRSVGIDPGRPDYRFVVLSVSVRGGVDLESWLSGFESGGPRDEVEGIRISVDETGRRTLQIAAPPVKITSFAVEDRNAAAEGFPDMPISPESWGVLVSGVSPRLREMALSRGLLEAADEQSRIFFTEIFTAAGYHHVQFID